MRQKCNFKHVVVLSFFLAIIVAFVCIVGEEAEEVLDCMQQGIAMVRAQQPEQALAWFKKVIACDPHNAEAYFYLGNIAFQMGHLDEAMFCYKQSLEHNPCTVEVACNLGICANVSNDHDAALEYFGNALKIDQNCLVAHTQIALLLEKRGQYAAALVHMQKASELMPHDVDILLYVGNLLACCDRLDEAIGVYRRAHGLRPDDIKVTIELANALASVDCHEEAITLYGAVLEKNPMFTSTLHNFGLSLKKVGYIDQAIEVFKKAILQKPEYALAHFSLGLAYLANGDFDHGWSEYEWRWFVYNESPKKFIRPRWDGSDVAGKRIYVYAEQGFGDTFHFIRYLALLKDQGAYVIFQCQAPLKQLLQLCPYIDALITFRDTFSEFDYHTPLLSLPLMFNTRVTTIPAQVPYLYAEERLVQQWRKKLDSDGTQFRVGICWHGNATYETAFLRHVVATKSCPLSHFKVLASVPGVVFYSLQKMHGLEQLTVDGNDQWLHTFDDAFDVVHGRFMDTAAVIQNLDLVISIDTSICHLAAALGVPTWILLPASADWRWMQYRADSPWYPTVRLFRQIVRGDWQGIMDTVAYALREAVGRKWELHSSHCVGRSASCCATESCVAKKLNQYIGTLQENNTVLVDCTNELAIAYAIKHDLAQYYSQYCMERWQ
jgi:tetratricopeptide (TPR) repeat protein